MVSEFCYATCNIKFESLREMCGNTNWTYNMRRTMQEVLPGVFLGPYSAAQKSRLNTLIQNGITHIVCVRHHLEAHFIKPNFPAVFKYLTLNIADSETENIICHFRSVRKFIDECLEGGGKVLIHGNGGISRSATLTVAYAMEKYKLTTRDAFTLVLQNRFCINPNVGFMAQLAEFEPIYRAQQEVQQTVYTCRNKRCLDR